MRLLAALAVWAAAILAAAGISSAVAGSIHTSHPSSSGTSTTGTSTTGGGSGSASQPLDPSSVTAADPRSLFHTANFSRAMSEIHKHLGPGTRVIQAVIYPGYLSIQTAAGGNEHDVYFSIAGSYDDTPGGAGSAQGQSTFPLSRIQSSVPAAIAARIGRFGHTPLSQLHYMVLQIEPDSSQTSWLVYPVQGNRVEYYSAAGATGLLQEYATNSTTGLKTIAH
jgi:hypothetical protein